MKYISILLPERVVEDIEKLVKEGYFMNRSDFVRTAIRLLIEKYIDELPDNLGDEDDED